MDEPPSPFFPYSDLPSTGERPSPYDESPSDESLSPFVPLYSYLPSTGETPSTSDEPPSPFFPYSFLPSTGEPPSPTNEPPSPLVSDSFLPSTDETLSPTDEPRSTMDELPSPTDEQSSQLLKSRIPRKTIIGNPDLFRSSNLRCPVRKGIIYYHSNGAIFEHNIYSSGKLEPRIIVPKHPSRKFVDFSLVPIKGNRILLFAKYFESTRGRISDHFLHVSIHEICPNSRVGPAVWSFNDSPAVSFNSNGAGDRLNFGLELIKFTENPLAITFWAHFSNQWKLFNISTTETDASDKFPLIGSGIIDFDLKVEELRWVRKNSLVKLSPDRHILLNADMEKARQNETIDIHYSDSGGTNFSFVTRISIPIPKLPKNSDFLEYGLQEPKLAFSADGSKFAIAMNGDRVSVWDIQSKDPLATLILPPNDHYILHLQFSSGKLGKEVLVFVARTRFSDLDIIHVIDVTSFEEKALLLKPKWLAKPGIFKGVGALFFDPDGETLYAEYKGTLYEWDLEKNECGPEWWIGEE